jgi:hypothetical protein
VTRKERRARKYGAATAAVATPPPSGFDQPREVTFGMPAARLMPAYADIPAEFRNRGDFDNPFVRLQAEWFFRGFKQWPLTPKPGIDHKRALVHLNEIQRSWDPPHEHKVAAVAYLMSLWYLPPKKHR